MSLEYPAEQGNPHQPNHYFGWRILPKVFCCSSPSRLLIYASLYPPTTERFALLTLSNWGLFARLLRCAGTIHCASIAWMLFQGCQPAEYGERVYSRNRPQWV